MPKTKTKKKIIPTRKLEVNDIVSVKAGDANNYASKEARVTLVNHDTKEFHYVGKNHGYSNFAYMKDATFIRKFVPGKGKKTLFKAGEWVKKGKRIGVVTFIGEADRDSFDLTQEIMVAFGNSSAWREDAKSLKKIPVPQYVVAFSNEDEDPLMRFEKRSEAIAFKKKILKDGFEGEKIVEANIYKLTK